LIRAHKKSSWTYRVEALNIPAGVSVVKGYCCVTESGDQAPLIQIQAVNIQNNAGKATMDFLFTYTTLDPVDPGTYESAVKLILSDGSAVLLQESILPFVVLPPYITDVT
jgi:hypothetical protein